MSTHMPRLVIFQVFEYFCIGQISIRVKGFLCVNFKLLVKVLSKDHIKAYLKNT